MSHRRRLWALAVLVVAFLTVGVPRWLAGDSRSGVSDSAAAFAKLCRERGARPVTNRPTRTGAMATRNCVVHYGNTEYVVDAVTSHGWDRDAAGLQREGCIEADREAAALSSGRRLRFVYHPLTGVCERRP
jgi:hypothetical protein